MQISHAQGELLAQVRLTGTAAVQLFQAAQLRTEITLIMASIDSGTADLSIYHDNAGSTWDASHRLVFTPRTTASDPKVFQAQHPGSGIVVKPGGTLGVQSSVANVMTVSVYGITESVAERIRGERNG